MIEFVVVEDNKEMNKIICDEVHKSVIKTKYDYHVHTFFDYDREFNKILDQENSQKVYILDIETPSNDGVTIGRKIRDKDLNSIIIYITSHDEFGSVLLRDEIMFLTFVNKNNSDYKDHLNRALNTAVKRINFKQAIRFETKYALYTIPLSDVLYITKNDDQQIVIYTTFNSTTAYLTLNNVMTMLDERFAYSHRSCIVNMENIIKVNKKLHIITFKDKTQTRLMNDNFKKIYSEYIKSMIK